MIIFFAGTFLLMNLLTPMFGDDYAYSFIWDGAQNGNFQNNIGKLERLESLGDIFQSQLSHYMTWGGRTVAHVIVQFFCLTGKIFFDVVNALMYAALALLIYIAGTEKFDAKNFCATRLLWIFFALWWCLPEFFQTTLWLTGACNYLWMAVGGLLAGWSNESGGAILILLTFAALERTTFNLSPKIFSAALTVWLVTIVYAVGVDRSVHSQMSERYEYVDAHKHDALIVVEPIDLPDVTHYIYRDWTPDEYARFYGDLTPYRDDFNNRNITYAQYYGVNEIILNEASWKKLQMFTLY